MNKQRKFSACLMAALIVYVSVSTSFVVYSKLYSNPVSEERVILSGEISYCPVFLIQEKSQYEISAIWKNNLKLHGFTLYFDICKLRIHELKLIRKIFVTDMEAFYPYRDYLLFPFHDFV